MPSWMTTNWSVVLAVANATTQRSQSALAILCETYWLPIYQYVRWDGHSPEDASDMVQGFFTRLIETDYLRNFERRDVKFRSFLLTAIKHYIINERRNKNTQKRGGGVSFVHLDVDVAENLYKTTSLASKTPETAFDRQWALSLLNAAIARLESRYHSRGKQKLFDVLKDYIQATPHLAYSEVAKELGMEENAVKVAVHRLRKRYKEALREEVAQTLADTSPEMVEKELRELLSALSR